MFETFIKMCLQTIDGQLWQFNGDRKARLAATNEIQMNSFMDEDFDCRSNPQQPPIRRIELECANLNK